MTQYDDDKEQIHARIVHAIAFADETADRLSPEDARSFRIGFMQEQGRDAARDFRQAYTRAYDSQSDQVRPTTDSLPEQKSLFGAAPLQPQTPEASPGLRKYPTQASTGEEPEPGAEPSEH